MAFNNPIRNLVEQITGAFSNIGQAFGLSKGTDGYWPDDLGVINKAIETDGDWKASRGYEFSVIGPNGSPASGWKPFRLQINPQELNQDEIFAIQVTPTFKGILVEHQGVTLRDITLSGTTGISPLRGSGGALSSGRPAFGKGHSGYIEFHNLRNYFRVYAEAKRRKGGDKIRMVFRNLRDREDLIVEPQRFKMKRSAAKPHLYNYEIVIKGVGRAGAKGKSSDWLSGVDTFFDKLNRVTTGLDDAGRVFVGAQGLIVATKRDFVDTILTPMRNISESVDRLKAGQKTLDETRSYVNELKNQVEILEDDLNDILGRDNAKYNSAKGRTPTLSGTSGRQSTYSELQVLNAVQKVKRSCTLLSQDNKLFQEDSEEAYGEAENQYGGKISLGRPETVKEIRIDGKDTIQTIAARELGDPDRFREIVILNNLRPPYIIVGGGSRLLAPGDKIMIPQDDGSPSTVGGVIRNKDYNITINLTEVEKNFGVDIAINEDNDLLTNNVGDIELVAGVNNISQAIFLKLFYNVGSLKRHLDIGTNLGVGQKATDARELSKEIESSLLSDPRINTIPFIELEQDGNVTKIKMVLTLKNLDQPVPLPLTI